MCEFTPALLLVSNTILTLFFFKLTATRKNRYLNCVEDPNVVQGFVVLWYLLVPLDDHYCPSSIQFGCSE